MDVLGLGLRAVLLVLDRGHVGVEVPLRGLGVDEALRLGKPGQRVADAVGVRRVARVLVVGECPRRLDGRVTLAATGADGFVGGSGIV
jgi:hypothetical protein